MNRSRWWPHVLSGAAAVGFLAAWWAVGAFLVPEDLNFSGGVIFLVFLVIWPLAVGISYATPRGWTTFGVAIVVTIVLAGLPYWDGDDPCEGQAGCEPIDFRLQVIFLWLLFAAPMALGARIRDIVQERRKAQV